MRSPTRITILATLLISLAVIAPLVVLASQRNNMMGTSASNDCDTSENGHADMHGTNGNDQMGQMHGENWQNHMGGNVTQHHQQSGASCH